jgi:hypothetical protein
MRELGWGESDIRHTVSGPSVSLTTHNPGQIMHIVYSEREQNNVTLSFMMTLHLHTQAVYPTVNYQQVVMCARSLARLQNHSALRTGGGQRGPTDTRDRATLTF